MNGVNAYVCRQIGKAGGRTAYGTVELLAYEIEPGGPRADRLFGGPQHHRRELDGESLGFSDEDGQRSVWSREHHRVSVRGRRDTGHVDAFETERCLHDARSFILGAQRTDGAVHGLQ